MVNILSKRDSDSLIQSMSKAVEISLDNLFLLIRDLKALDKLLLRLE